MHELRILYKNVSVLHIRVPIPLEFDIAVVVMLLSFHFI
jgi:hypothetical protein